MTCVQSSVVHCGLVAWTRLGREEAPKGSGRALQLFFISRSDYVPVQSDTYSRCLWEASSLSSPIGAATSVNKPVESLMATFFSARLHADTKNKEHRPRDVIRNRRRRGELKLVSYSAESFSAF